MGILYAAAFVIHSITNSPNCYSQGQLIFGRDIILLIKHRVGWELRRQQKQTHINRDNTRENKHRVYYNYKIGNKVMLTNHTAHKYETPYKGPFVITLFFTNSTVTLKCGASENRHNICHIKPYKSDTKVKDSNSINIWMTL